MSTVDKNVGKIFYLGCFPGSKPRLLKVLNIYYDPAYHAGVFQGITNTGNFELDRTVFLTYLREATTEEILLYWPNDV